MALKPSELDDPGQIRLHARKLAQKLDEVATKSKEIQTTWSALTVSYSAPEGETVHNAMNKPDNYARTLKGHTATMRDALVAYADRLDELKKVRDQLVKDIAAHEAKESEARGKKQAVWHPMPGGTGYFTDSNAVDEKIVTEANELTTRVEQFETDLEDAQRECGNKLNATWGGPQFVQADKTNVNNPYTYGSSVDSKRDQTRTGDAPWGKPDAWKSANSYGQGVLIWDGIWRNVLGSFTYLKDISGFGSDSGATEYARSSTMESLKSLTMAVGFFSLKPEETGLSPEEYEAERKKHFQTLKETFKGAISYDTWDADPWGTVGALAPDIASMFTPGVGATATKITLKALKVMSPTLALKVARVAHLLNLADKGTVADLASKVDLHTSAKDLRKLESLTDGNVPHARADGSDVTPTQPHSGAGPIESGASGGHHSTADGVDRGYAGDVNAGGGNHPRAEADSPQGHVNGSGDSSDSVAPSEVEPRRAAPESPEARDIPDGSSARRSTERSDGSEPPIDTDGHSSGSRDGTSGTTRPYDDISSGSETSREGHENPTHGNSKPVDHPEESITGEAAGKRGANAESPSQKPNGAEPQARADTHPTDGTNSTPDSKNTANDSNPSVRESDKTPTTTRNGHEETSASNTDVSRSRESTPEISPESKNNSRTPEHSDNPADSRRGSSGDSHPEVSRRPGEHPESGKEGSSAHPSRDGDGSSSTGQNTSPDASKLPDPPTVETWDGKEIPNTLRPGQAKERFGVDYTDADVKHAYDNAFDPTKGNHVDPRTGEPLVETTRDGRGRGWEMRYDPATKEWSAWNKGDGYGRAGKPIAFPDYDPAVGKTYSSGDGLAPGDPHPHTPPETHNRATGTPGVEHVNRGNTGGKENPKIEKWLKYQEQITGWKRNNKGEMPEYTLYDSQGEPVRIDGRTWRGHPPQEVYLDAKRGYQILHHNPTHEKAVGIKGNLIDEANRQLGVLPPGAKLEWHISSREAADAISRILAKEKIYGVDVIYTPER